MKSALKAPARKTPRSPKSVDHSQRLKARRMMMGISQTELGNAVGLTFQQIQKYERGVNRISAGHLFQFAGVLGCSPEYFYEGLNSSGRTVDTPLDAFLRSKEGPRSLQALLGNRCRSPGCRGNVHAFDHAGQLIETPH